MVGFLLDLRSIPEPQDATRPAMSLTPALMGRIALCAALIAMGMYYVLSGRERQSVGRMALGALMVIGAFFVF